MDAGKGFDMQALLRDAVDSCAEATPSDKLPTWEIGVFKQNF